MRKSAGELASGASGAQAPAYPIESVGNALRILLLFGERSELRLTEVGEYLGVASSTAHRLLAMLQYHGFVRRDPATKVYGPGTALTGVAFSVLQRFDVREAVRPHLQWLNRELAETVHLGVLDGAEVRFIDAVESPQAVRVTSRIGRTVPAHCTSTGKAMLAQLGHAELRLLYPDEELPGLMPHSLRTRTALAAELAEVSVRGYATSSEESEEGVASIAVAFPPARGPRMAFNVACPVHRMTRAAARGMAEVLKTSVAEAAQLIG